MRTFSRILYPTDFSPSARVACSYALGLAEKLDAEIRVLHTVDVPDVGDEQLKDQILGWKKESASTKLNDLLEESAGLRGTMEARVVTHDSPVDAILDEAVDFDADLIVLGAYGRHGKRTYALGRVAGEIFRRAGVPVLTVPLEDNEDRDWSDVSIRKVMVPTDFSKYAEDPLAYARQIAMPFDAGLLLFHVVEDFVPPGVYGIDVNPIRDLAAQIEERARRELDRMADALRRDGLNVEQHLASGHAPNEIVRFADDHDVDLIVLASYSSRVERFLVGSVAEKVVRAARCPVLTVKPEKRM